MSAVKRKDSSDTSPIGETLSLAKKGKLDEITALISKAVKDQTRESVKTAYRFVRHSSLTVDEVKINLALLRDAGLITDEKFAKILFMTAVQNKDSHAIDEHSTYLPNLDFFLAKADMGSIPDEELHTFIDHFYTVDPAHFKAPIPRKVNNETPAVDFNQLMTLFEEINFTDPSQSNYYSPNNIDEGLTVEQITNAFKVLVNKLVSGKGEDPEFMENLRILYQKTTHLLL
jgi:hypothetical protein